MDAIQNFFSKVNVDLIMNIAGVLAFGLIGGLVLILLGKTEQIRILKQSLHKMTRAFNDLDEQAKLIVKTDMALAKAQEELDKRMASLNALHKVSRLISTTLDVNEIFKRLGKSLVMELGFEKGLLLMFDENKNLFCRLESGYSEKMIEQIIAHLPKDHLLFSTLKEGRPLSSLNSPKQKKEKIANILSLEHFVLAPILSQDGMIGILCVGNESADREIAKSDEELISILSNQIGQSIENAQLFEQVYRSRQELEFKIQERTKELAAVLEEVKKISKAKTDFVSAVSHELRTPLTSIKGYASILMTDKLGQIPPQAKERLDKINKHSDNLVKLINDLLDISRIESGRVEMKHEEHNIQPLIENIRDLLTPQMAKKNIRFTAQIANDIPSIYIDNTQIERVLINLLGNAIKFTPPNGTITIGVEHYNGGVLFKISDTGIGIKDEDIPRLFSEFYRVDNEVNQAVKGTGLGLVLAKNIIEAHHGKIWVTSKLNHGTTFYFTLPINKETKNE